MATVTGPLRAQTSGETDRPSPDPADDRHLRTEHLHRDLAVRSIRGGVITLTAQGVKIVVQFLAIITLARLLAPEDFGRFAMVAAFLVVLELFKDLGLSTATVQRSNITNRDVSTLFWLNLGLGLAASALLAALAPMLVWLYGEPVLLEITPVVALAFVFTGLAAQHLALLRRQMCFTAVATVQVGAEMAALAAAVGAALGGLGLWALVIQRLTWAAAIAIGAWCVCDWRPGRPGRLADVREFIAFGGNATGAMTISHLASSLDKVLIGWYWGAAPLGFFERAQKLLQLPIQNLNTPLATVALPMLSRLADQPARYRESYLAMVERLTMLVAPIGGLFIPAADLVVALLFGPQWTDAAPILSWMGVSTVYMPVTYTLSWLYMSQDRTPEMLRAGFVNAALTLTAIAIGLPFGAVGVAAALVASGALVRAPVLFWLVGRSGPVRARDLGRVLMLPAGSAAAVAGVVMVVRDWPPLVAMSAPAAAAVLVTIAIGVALAIYAAFPRGRRILGDAVRLPQVLFGGRASA
jgi:PST family polysaccharide transporter